MTGEVEPYERNRVPPHVMGMLAPECWRRRLRGQSVPAIARDLGWSPKQVRHALRIYQEANPDPDLGEYRRLELDRIDLARERLESLLSQAARRGEIAVTDDGIRVIVGQDFDFMRKLIMDLAKLGERESRFLGLDAPEKREVEVTVQSQEEKALSRLFDRINQEQGS